MLGTGEVIVLVAVCAVAWKWVQAAPTDPAAAGPAAPADESADPPKPSAPPAQPGMSLFGCLRGLAGGFVLLVILGSFVDPKSTSSGSRSAPAANLPEVQVTSSQLVAAYVANEVAADKLYKGRTVEVSGSIRSIGKDVMDEMYVCLDSDDLIRATQCFFDKSHEDALSKMSKGQFVRIVGRCNGVFGNVMLKDSAFR